MKKLLASLLIMVMSTTLLIGCGGSDTNTGKDNADNDTNTTSVVQDEEEPTPETIDLGGQVILDNEIAKITANKLDAYSGKKGAKYNAYLSVTVEMKSQHDSLFLDGVRINNKDMNGMWEDGNALDITAGETKEAKIELWDNEIREIEQKHTDIVLELSVYQEGYISFESEHFYPYGEDAVVTYQRPLEEDDIVVLDDEHVRVIVTETIRDADFIDWTYYIENKTDKAIYPLIANEKVGGVEWDFYQNDSDKIPANGVSELHVVVAREEVEYVAETGMSLSYETLDSITYTLWILDASTFNEDTYDDIRGWEKYGETKFHPEVYELSSIEENYNPQNFNVPEEE